MLDRFKDAKWYVGGEANPRCISLRDAKEMVEAVMVQLGIPAQLG